MNTLWQWLSCCANMGAVCTASGLLYLTCIRNNTQNKVPKKLSEKTSLRSRGNAFASCPVECLLVRFSKNVSRFSSKLYGCFCERTFKENVHFFFPLQNKE